LGAGKTPEPAARRHAAATLLGRIDCPSSPWAGTQSCRLAFYSHAAIVRLVGIKRKKFFFEKKNQKTFVYCPTSTGEFGVA
jgi:hypothetical protein